MSLEDPDQLFLSLRLSPNDPPLRRESDELCFQWAVKISDSLRETPEYKAFASKVGLVCADLFIEKELFTSLLPVARALIRRVYLKKLAQDGWRKPIRTVHRALILLLREIWPEPEIQLEAQNFREYRLRTIARAIRNRWYGWNQRCPSSDKPRLGIEMIEGVADEGHRGELLWWDESSPAPDALFCLYVFPWLFKGQKHRIESLKSKGVLFAAQYKSMARQIGAYYCPIPTGNGFSIASSQSNRAAWLRNRIPAWLFAVDWWERLFRHAKIKVWLSVDEAGIQSIATRAAMDRIGGITLFRQRSEYLGYPDSVGLMPSHLVLVWNKATAEYLNLCRNRNEKILIIGHTMGATPSSNFNGDNEIREEMKKKGACFIITFLDAIFTRDQNMNPDDLRSTYNWLLKWLVETQDGGLIVKPKKAWVHTKQYVDSGLLKKAQATGRLRFFFNQPHLLPITVSNAADITIGLGLSSAALEANIAGLRAIHFHRGGSGSHILERKAYGRVLFRNLEDIQSAVQSVQTGQESDIGLIRDLLPEIDEYGDGCGPERMRQVMELMMEINLDDRRKVFHELDQLAFSWRMKHREIVTSSKLTSMDSLVD